MAPGQRMAGIERKNLAPVAHRQDQRYRVGIALAERLLQHREDRRQARAAGQAQDRPLGILRPAEAAIGPVDRERLADAKAVMQPVAGVPARDGG